MRVTQLETIAGWAARGQKPDGSPGRGEPGAGMTGQTLFRHRQVMDSADPYAGNRSTDSAVNRVRAARRMVSWLEG